MKYPGSELHGALYGKVQTVFVVDIETTGLDFWRNEILTMSLSALDNATLERKDSIELTFKPKNLEYWEAGAEKVHGISISRALQFDDKVTSSLRALKFLRDHHGGTPGILVCHALDMFRSHSFFDVAFIMAHMEKLGLRQDLYQCVRFFQSTDSYFREAMARGYLRLNDPDTGRRTLKLNALCELYNIPLKHHDAKSDREACESLYRIARRLGSDEDERELGLSGDRDGKDVPGRAGYDRPLYPGEGREAHPAESDGAAPGLHLRDGLETNSVQRLV